MPPSLDAVYALLQKKWVRDLTIEEVAKRAVIGKPTLYNWWPTKANPGAGQDGTRT
jgi:AcrR family transcriptional regulator